jgi:intracellular septation protein
MTLLQRSPTLYMKLLFDFFPVVLFFIAYKFFGDMPPAVIDAVNMLPFVTIDQNEPKHAILFATVVIIIATLVQNLLYFLRHRRLERMHVITLVLLLAFGALTLALKDPIYIKWKVSIINWIFALVFLGSQFVGAKKTITERLMSQAIQAPQAVWQRVNWAWVVFFIGIGVLNLVIVYGFSEAVWVNFKLFGVLGLTFLFIIAQVLYLQKYATPTSES